MSSDRCIAQRHSKTGGRSCSTSSPRGLSESRQRTSSSIIPYELRLSYLGVDSVDEVGEDGVEEELVVADS